MNPHSIPVRLFAILINIHSLLQIADLGQLNSMQRVRGTGFAHRKLPGCLKGTRVALLDEIDQWSKDGRQPPIFWLNGLAGSGKSTIAQTVAERCFVNGTLGASFFCSSNASLKDHDNPDAIFPSLAFQLAQKYPDFRSALVPRLRSNPDIEYESLGRQVEKLIVEPLQSANIETVIVIDALDECKDEGSSSKILLALNTIIQSAPKTKFFITSRPDPRISRDFYHPKKHHIVALHNIASEVINNDIRVFLQHELFKLAAGKKLDNWPSGEQLDLLCNRAGGLFAYAVATIKFLSGTSRMIHKRYNKINESPHDTSYEGTAKGVHGGSSLDCLCTSILRASFTNNRPEDDVVVRSILAAAALFTPAFPPSAIPDMVRTQTGELMEIDDVMDILESIHSLLELREDPDHPVRPFHRLLSDCLTNPNRCFDERFLIRRDPINT